MNTAPPINYKDLVRRKDLIEEFVYADNKSFILTNELKKLSKYYIQEKIEYKFITPTTGQVVTFILTNGRLYLSCDNYGEVFGYSVDKPRAKIDNLNASDYRERDVIYGLFKLYDMILEKYIEKFNIVKESKTVNTEAFEQIVSERGLDDDMIKLIKNSKLIKDVEFNKVTVKKENSGDRDKGKDSGTSKPKFYI
jgi:hypothetical protein